jgi:hypothetical protein
MQRIRLAHLIKGGFEEAKGKVKEKDPKDECSVVSDFVGAFQVNLDLSGTNLTLTLTFPMEPGSENNCS